MAMKFSRPDGRQRDQLRDLRLSFEGLGAADGSAVFGFGDTKAIASVSGPIEVRLANEQASRATLEVIVRPLSNVPGTESKSLASVIRSILAPSLLLSHHPRTLIQLVVQSLSPTPSSRFPFSLLASLINASTLALLNCGSVPMCGVTCAVAVGFVRSRGAVALVVDPGDEECECVECGGAFAFLFSANFEPVATPGRPPGCEVVWSDWQATRPFGEVELVEARKLAQDCAVQIWLQMKQSIS